MDEHIENKVYHFRRMDLNRAQVITISTTKIEKGAHFLGSSSKSQFSLKKLEEHDSLRGRTFLKRTLSMSKEIGIVFRKWILPPPSTHGVSFV